MDIVYTLGISSLWDEVRHMPPGGVWWVNVDRHSDAVSLLNHTLAAQEDKGKLAAIVMGDDPNKIISLSNERLPEKVILFSMPDSPEALETLHRDLLCSVKPANYLFILLSAENAWQRVNIPALHRWVEKSNSWTKHHHCSLLIFNSGRNIDEQLSPLLREHRALSGLASIRYRGDNHLLDIAWWGSDKGISAQQQLVIQHNERGWHLVQQEGMVIQSHSDKKVILSNQHVLEGAPALSGYWKLFESNEAVFNAGRAAQAATLLFSITRNEQVEQLGRYIHTLRRQRGSALKIAVREQIASLRATDERLLLSCGANIVIPDSASLSRCLSLIESIQKQTFTHHIPENFATLLNWNRPLKLRGYQKWDVFCDAVSNVIANTLLPSDSKGVMIALRPVPGLRVEQALTLCSPGRMGDIMTIGNDRLVLFLSFCRINDLDIALSHIFPLPVGDIFSNRMIWFEDKQIAAELLIMRSVPPDSWNTPLPITINKNKTVSEGGRRWRRRPRPHRLSGNGDAPL